MTSSNVHSEYVKILEKLKMNKEILDENSSELNEIVEASNSLFNEIENTSDLKIDAKISSMYSEVYLKIFKKDLHGKSISSDKFIELANSKKSKDLLDYFASSSKGLSFIPFIDFNYFVEKKERKYTKINREIKDAETPLDSKNVTEEVKSEFLIGLLKRLEQKEHLPYYKTVLNCNSYPKTIENIFQLSLAIRMKTVMLCAIDDELFLTKYRESEGIYNEHIVEELDYKRFNDLKKHYGTKVDY